MTADIGRKSAARFARDVAARFEGGDITLFIVSSDEHVQNVSEDVSSALAQFVRGRSVALASSATARELLDRLTSIDTIHVAAIRGWATKAWRELDLHRARLERHTMVMVMSEASATTFVAEAPHLYSFVSESILEGPDEALLTIEEREQRIAALEALKGFSSNDLIDRALAGKLPPDSEYGEWLLLLGRGDLL